MRLRRTFTLILFCTWIGVMPPKNAPLSVSCIFSNRRYKLLIREYPQVYGMRFCWRPQAPKKCDSGLKSLRKMRRTYQKKEKTFAYYFDILLLAIQASVSFLEIRSRSGIYTCKTKEWAFAHRNLQNLLNLHTSCPVQSDLQTSYGWLL